MSEIINTKIFLKIREERKEIVITPIVNRKIKILIADLKLLHKDNLIKVKFLFGFSNV